MKPRMRLTVAVAQALLKGAVGYARKSGAALVEAYPVDKPVRSNETDMLFGAKCMYDKAGFTEVARRKPQRPIVRLRPVRLANVEDARSLMAPDPREKPRRRVN